MAKIHPDLSLVKKKFPGQGSLIEEFYNSNPNFQALCTDYFLCIATLNKFLEEVNENKSTIKEYKNIQGELEKEIDQFLHKK